RREMKDLLSVIDRIRKMASQPAIFVDVHTFSADGALFTLPSHRTETIQMLSQMYVPVVEGIADALQGTTLKYYGDQGMISFALEGGQHHSSETRSEEHTSELQSRFDLVCRLLLEKK